MIGEQILRPNEDTFYYRKSRIRSIAADAAESASGVEIAIVVNWSTKDDLNELLRLLGLRELPELDAATDDE